MPPAPTTAHKRPWPSSTPPALLIAVVDLHPLAWSLLSNLQPIPSSPSHEKEKAPIAPLTLGEFATNLMVFLNAHLASRWGNEVVVYGATAGKAVLLYPQPGEPSTPQPNFYQPFQMLDSRFEEQLKAVFAAEEERLAEVEGKGLNDPPALVSALTKALCYINRLRPPEVHSTGMAIVDDGKSSNPEQPESRILVLNATPGGAEDEAALNGKTAKASGGSGGQRGYVGLMNCVFAAQKAHIPIDVLTLPPESTKTSPPIFLQQAAHLTGGIYWRWNGRGGILQYLHSLYLPPPSLRKRPFTQPPQDAVDFRAVCFCHQDVVDVGFVCSVCLSIFCQPKPVCPMCKTKFPRNAWGTLKELAANVEPIPLPNTVPAPLQKKQRPATNGASNGPPPGAEVIEIL
ncbi:transcription factor Tfb4 [Cutaneotrichosporon oleaginosum]|uniref:General transcription and DNA repair factor IIH subunit TFB4 n=1 Tax=Cutaneotrichosporon oleaginosum TaxID=879819 RepID=A0A0J0XKM8_9TREE|nr:transcription factor Tfb4 [Cutaneotrichosporon oleaginosum]KLT41668.1 transcription factor Tfb4 [Cutaneotrichosporon oleaginosum]TXT08040.1 hypothetical protein COLE_04964 [Cutaneotrichosporon oleaginosum]